MLEIRSDLMAGNKRCFKQNMIFSETLSVVFNRFYQDDEERVGAFPFKRGETFKIGIAITRESYHFYVNGRFYAYYNHRGGTPNELAVLKCWAPPQSTDLTINGIEYNDGPVHFNKLTTLEMSE